MDAYPQRLLERANRTFRNAPIADFANRIRAIIGPAAAAIHQQAAQAALEALSNGEEPSPSQLAALEMVIRTMRPAPLSRSGELEDLDDDVAPTFAHWEHFRKTVKPFLYSIGRIDLTSEEGVGTGFLVSNTLLVTNKHVLDALSRGTQKLEKGQAVVRFKEEYQSPTEDPVDIAAVVAVHPTLDMVLLRVEKKTFDHGRLPLPIDATDVEPGQPVVAIGYPFEDKTRNPLFIGAIFGDRFGVKRAAPGEVIGTDDQLVFHDCSTLGGNSGSPILAMDEARVVGIHCDGFFMYRNEAVSGPSLGSFVAHYV